MVQENYPNTALHDHSEPVQRRSRGHDDDASHSHAGQEREDLLLADRVGIRGAQHRYAPRLAQPILYSTGSLGEKRVGHVVDDNSHNARSPIAQTACGLRTHEPQRRDGPLHALASRLRDTLRMIEHVGDGAHGHACMGSDVSHGRTH